MMQRVCEFLKHLSLIGAALILYTNGGREEKKVKPISTSAEDVKAKQK